MVLKHVLLTAACRQTGICKQSKCLAPTTLLELSSAMSTVLLLFACNLGELNILKYISNAACQRAVVAF